MKSNLDILRNFGAIADELKNKPVSDDYWIKEQKMLDKLHEKQEKERKSYTMSYEKYHQPFTI